MVRYVSFVAIAVISLRALAAAADFEDLALPPNSVQNTTPFASGGAQFNNSFEDFEFYTVWSGFAYSSKADTTTPGFGNQFSAITGCGAGNSATYGIGYVGGTEAPTITLPAGASPLSLEVTNTTYAYLSMRDGDGFAKKFGGPTGNDPDFFLLSITDWDAAGATIDHVDFYLADFRSSNNSQDYLLHTWTEVDLTRLAGARKLTFALSSTDNDPLFGMNTPGYFAIDNVRFVPEPCTLAVIGAIFVLSSQHRRRT